MLSFYGRERPVLCLPAGHRQHDAHFAQQHHQTGAAGGKKRQADAGIGDGVGDYRHIQHCLQGHLHHKAHYQQRTEPIRCMRRQRDAPPQQQCKQQDHRAGSHKAKLLAQDGKDEVVLRFGHEQVLLAAAAKAKARRTPFGVETALGYLIAAEAELTAVRTIMTGRRAGLSADAIRERLRDIYG